MEEVGAGIQVGTKAESVEKCCLLPGSLSDLSLVKLSYTAQDHLWIGLWIG